MLLETPRRTRLRRGLVMIGLSAAFVWALVALTGGFVVQAGPLRLSSRNTFNPLLMALLSGAAAWLLAPAGARGRTLAADVVWIQHLVPSSVRARWRRALRIGAQVLAWLPGRPAGSTAVAAGLAIAVVALGLGRGALVVGGADSYGYVSQAQIWADGTLRLEQPLDLSGVLPPEALAPLGYRPAGDGTAIVPIYAPGLPLIMAVFQRLWGPAAVFWVMPLLAGTAVWATARLGRRVGGGAAGLGAAILLAASPAFLFQLTGAPMSDIPVTACWAGVLILLPLASRRAAFAGGAATGLAILIRPNLAPLALIPGGLLLWAALRRRPGRRAAIQRLLLFGATAVPACVSLAVLQAHWYGSPLLSGYGPLAAYFSWTHVWPNLVDYSRWVIATQTPIVIAAAAAPFLVTRGEEQTNGDVRTIVLASACFAAGVYLCYALYLPLGSWWSLRLLLPAFPPLLVLTAAVVFALGARLPEGARTVGPAMLVAAVAIHGLSYAHERGVFNPAGEWKYAVAGRFAAERLPDRAVLFSMQHSGSIRYYSGRMTVRYDLLGPGQLEPAIAAVRRLGYRPYFLLEPWEEDEFQRIHGETSTLAALDWPPMAVLQPGGVRIYEPPERDTLAVTPARPTAR